jgi:ribulose-phosphate 3-epimerase
MTMPANNWLEPFAKAGADIITIHLEAEKDIKESLKIIKDLGLKAGISIKPSTSENILEKYIELCDLVLVMTVNPGFGGQKFINTQLKKIQNIKKMQKNMGITIDIEVDGGINKETSKLCIAAGANVLVAGNAIFSENVENYSSLINLLRNNN